MMDPRTWQDSYDDGVPDHVPFESLTLPQLLFRSAERYPQQIAIDFLGRKLRYDELASQVRQFAQALAELGVEPGDRVAIQLPNLPQTVIAFYGTLARGAVAVMTNPLYTAPELIHQWNDAGCKVAVTTDFLYESRVRDCRNETNVEHVIVASIPEYLGFPIAQLARLKLSRENPPLVANVPEGDGVIHFRKLVDRTTDRPIEKHPTLDDLAALQYTGGTTGVSKGAMLSHGNLSWNTQQIRQWLPTLNDGEETFLSVLPFFHVFGLTVAMNLPLFLAGKLVLLPNPRDCARMIASINKHQVTIFPVVPAMVNGINQHPKASTLQVKSLKLCVSGSAPLREDTLQQFEDLTGGRIVEGFGLTEASPVTHVNPTKRKINTIGLPLPDTECRLYDENDPSRELGVDEEGELLIRGPQVMQGYWKREDETKSTLRDGWLYTGDLASMDAEGYFRICGRKKEVIIAGGYNIYPDEVDRVLSAHPAVLECATIGVPHERRGETVKSFVVLLPDQEATEEELRSFCRESLAPYKVPSAIAFRDELPKSSVLKILRRELLAEELGERESSGQEEESAC